MSAFHLPLALALTAVAWSTVVALHPALIPFSPRFPIGGAGIPQVLLYLAVVGVAVVLFTGTVVRRAWRTGRGWAGYRSEAGPADGEGRASDLSSPGELGSLLSARAEVRSHPSPRAGAGAGDGMSRARAVAVALLLLAVVVSEGLLHLGEQSGFWITGRPRFEYEEETADGHVFWIDGHPVQSDSMFFIMDYEELSGRGLFRGHLAQPGRAAYPFLVSLVARPFAPLLGVLGAFIAVNLLCWWVGALAMFDLTRRAVAHRRGAPLVGLAAGLFSATGMGLTFAVGNPMPNAAAYAAVVGVLWLAVVLPVSAGGTAWHHRVLHGSLAGSLSMLYSLAPLLMLFAIVSFEGSLAGLLVWGGTLLMVSLVWSQVSLQPALVPGAFGPAGLVPLVAAVVIVAVAAVGGAPAGLHRWGARLERALRRRQSRYRAAVASGGGGPYRRRGVLGAAALLVLAGGVWITLSTLAGGQQMVREQVARTLTPVNFRVGGAMVERHTQTWPRTLEAVRGSFMDVQLAAAFPVTLIPLAVAGTVGLSKRWLRWCLALVASVGVMTYLQTNLSTIPHPRLMFFAFPAVYLLAAHGLANVFRWTVAAAAVLRTPPVAGRLVGAAVVGVLLWPPVAASNALRAGNLFYAERFHVGNS